jgi:beta-carotene hydroxylase
VVISGSPNPSVSAIRPETNNQRQEASMTTRPDHLTSLMESHGQTLAVENARPSPKIMRPRLPPEFHRVNPLGVSLYLAHALGFFLVPAYLATMLVHHHAPLALRLPIAIALGLIAGHGLHLLTFVGHEGLHTNLHRNKYVSSALALLFCAPVPFFFIVGYSVTHWKHHRFSGQKSDPDAQIFSRYRNFFSRFFLGRSKGVRIYVKNAALLAFNLKMPEGTKLPFSESELRWLARFNIALGVCAVIFYARLIAKDPFLGAIVVGIPYLSLYVLTCLRAYIEHSGTTPGQFLDSRSYTSPIYTALFYGGNFHLEHHLYPAVPSYRLPALHAYLAATGIFGKTGANVENSFFGAFRYTTSKFQYPFTKDKQDIDDAFLESVAEGRIDRS